MSLTTVLDLYISPTVRSSPLAAREQSWCAFPENLKPQVLRIVMYDRWSKRLVRLPPARTVVIYQAADVRHTMSSIPYLSSINVVCKLNYFDRKMGQFFDYTGPCDLTNVFVLLSNCEPNDTHLGGLWRGIVETVAENARSGKQTFFHLVDVPSWFTKTGVAESITDAPETEEPRMDHILDDPDAFSDMIDSTHEAYVQHSPLCGEDLVELVAAGCQCSSFIRRISIKEMRAIIGTKATSFALATVDKTLYKKRLGK